MVKRYGLVIDLERCAGCHSCRIACKVENSIEKGSGILVTIIGGAYRDTPAGTFPNLSMYYRPTPCMHCTEPPCLDACPVEAIYKRNDGIVFVDEEKCNGCQACVSACPYGSLIIDTVKNVVRKCNLCAHRLDDGLDPFCVICCPHQAILFGDLNDPLSKVSQLIVRRNACVLNPELETKPVVYYCPVL